MFSASYINLQFYLFHSEPIEGNFISRCNVIVKNFPKCPLSWGAEIRERKVLHHVFWHQSYDMVIIFNMSTMIGVVNYSLIILPTFLYVATSIEFFHFIWPTVGAINQCTLEVTALLQYVLQCLYWLCPWINDKVWPPTIFISIGEYCNEPVNVGYLLSWLWVS